MNMPSTLVHRSISGKRRNVLVFPGRDEDFAIDEDDYRVISDILSASGLEGDQLKKEERWMVEIRQNDEERRIHKFRMPVSFLVRSLPASIGNLENLTHLDLRFSCIRSIPPSIGQLKDVRVLNLSCNDELLELPEEIGDMRSLNKLDLRGLNIRTIPPFIGKSQNLECLDLYSTTHLSNLPEEIGDLQKLKKLDLSLSGIRSLPPFIGRLRNLEELHLFQTEIRSLPPSVGRLQNLKDLDLSSTHNLTVLPKEIGEMTSLKKLNLKSSPITVLPPSIGRLQKLTDLNLSYTPNLLNLPKEIWELRSLNKFNLCSSNIQSLSSSIGKLQKLEQLYLHTENNFSKLPEEIGNLANLTTLALAHSGNSQFPLPEFLFKMKGLMRLSLRKFYPEANDLAFVEVGDLGKIQHEFLLLLSKRCRLLGFVGWEMDTLNHREVNRRLKTPYEKELWYALACNRAGARTGLGMSPNLWPLVVNHATRAFTVYSSPGADDHDDFEVIPEPDAIYQLLVDKRDSFVGVLLNRARQRTCR
jgi:Leucine-rich repeat (LRR) protein